MREIPYNYTSANDKLIVCNLLGKKAWDIMEHLRKKRVTGRSARLLMRFLGSMFILNRNPFIMEKLLASFSKRYSFFRRETMALKLIRSNSLGDPDVSQLINYCEGYIKNLEKRLKKIKYLRKKIKKLLTPIIGKENISFDPFTLVSHATDATDWRLFLPFAVVRPIKEDMISSLLLAIKSMKLNIIPRGAGTGLTGGAIPLKDNCIIVNIERLNNIKGIEKVIISNSKNESIPLLHLEAGVITENAMQYAADKGLVFATDPTSAWACTIGGNIAENAGGKTAVLWGTAIDNIFSYKMVMPTGDIWEICRKNHNRKKILSEDKVIFEIKKDDGTFVKTITLHGWEIRKKGLWKDITNKALKGLPGLQKEGTDGIITSAKFILHKAYIFKKTFCVEFFGSNMDEASQVILDLSKKIINKGQEAIMALEHFDHVYAKAINYEVKAPRAETPRAVLLIDLVAHNNEDLFKGTNKLKDLLSKHKDTYLFAASDDNQAKLFWQDRKRLGAIAARTNAFKLNEDIVLPLHALKDFSKYVDKCNENEEKYSQLVFIKDIKSFLLSTEEGNTQWLGDKLDAALNFCKKTQDLLIGSNTLDLQNEKYISYLKGELADLFQGNNLIISKVDKIHNTFHSRLIVIATHMHAGDGNIHVNIPVFSNDIDMMNRAHNVADLIMNKAVELGGVVSGEHGIGITKIKYLTPDRIVQLNNYRNSVDPNRIMNPKKLCDTSINEKVFTPSFNLLELEAHILQRGLLESLAIKISKCIRCGRCKSDCCVFYPAKKLFFHPRNKNLAIGAIIEALLFSVQRSHSIRFESLKDMEEIADHCTICHKCLTPCPVNIDTGKVSILERNILSEHHYKHTSLGTRLVLGYLENSSLWINYFFRKFIIQWGGKIQRNIAIGTGKIPGIEHIKIVPPLFNSPTSEPSKETLRHYLPNFQNNQSLVLYPEKNIAASVFYFPGCGSERLFSNISLASIYILLKAGVRVVLPPSYLCCGFPFQANASSVHHNRIVLKNKIIFSQIREMLGHLKFNACVVSCGTCMEALTDIEVGKIFNCKVRDVSDFVLEQVKIKTNTSRKYFYHTPCHDSLQGQVLKKIQRNTNFILEHIPHCCSEAGTMALSRPDITTAMLVKKNTALSKKIDSYKKDVNNIKNPLKKILTNCPSCIQGLGRNRTIGIKPFHFSEEFALILGGTEWIKDLTNFIKKSERISF